MTGSVGVGIASPATSLDIFSGTAGDHAPIARFGSNGANDCNSILTYTGSGSVEIFAAGAASVGCFIPGAAAGDAGLRVPPGNRILLGDETANRVLIDAAGNVEQQRSAGGMVKGMVYVNARTPPYNILKCFNSALAGAAATTPPCGINFTENSVGAGFWDFDFGFEVDDRFFSATATNFAECTAAVPISPNTVQVQTSDCGGSPAGADFYLIVY